MPDFRVQPISDKARARQFVMDRWGGYDFVVSRGKTHHPAELPGFIVLIDDQWVGMITYHIVGDNCEVVTIDSVLPGIGIGTVLMKKVIDAALEAQCMRLWIITTNDNLNALKFYQKLGFVLVAVHPNAMEVTRKLKPGIPQIGMNGIPLRDELELEMRL
jgi:RimJ/RimL family protein N-acetyltransferase